MKSRIIRKKSSYDMPTDTCTTHSGLQGEGDEQSMV
jgi:hypothetical protein